MNKDVTLADYTAEVKKAFLRYVGKSEDAEKWFISNEAQFIIKTNYKDFSNPKFTLGGCEPEATAGCLYMMYD